MFVSETNLITAMSKVKKGFIEADHDSFLFVNYGFIVVESKGFVLIISKWIDAKELSGFTALVCKYEANDIFDIGESWNKTD